MNIADIKQITVLMKDGIEYEYSSGGINKFIREITGSSQKDVPSKKDSAKKDSAKKDSAKKDSAKKDSAKKDSAKKDSAKKDIEQTSVNDIMSSASGYKVQQLNYGKNNESPYDVAKRMQLEAKSGGNNMPTF